jgi:hypothetical protein
MSKPVKTLSQSRRKFLQSMLVASGMAALPKTLFAQSTYQGKFLLTLQLDGGVDVTSFCDPKTNVAGEREINRWARTKGISTAGNLTYAPYGKNAAFFDKYYRQILVINGVDAQTNSHTVGVVHNWSGRNSEGFPSLTALFAAVHQPQLPMAYLNFGGFGATQGITTSTRVSNTSDLRTILRPNLPTDNPGKRYVPDDDMSRIMALHRKQLGVLNADAGAVGGNLRNRQLYTDAITKIDGIGALASVIPSDDKLQGTRPLTKQWNSNLFQQIQMALLAFKAGVSVAADLFEPGFDTHDIHDDEHPLLLGNATDAVDYLWTYAEELGLANRIVLVIGTDFGRTPYFNSAQGKDHWPIGSTLVMEKNAAYTNRVIGKTDGGHNVIKINPTTFAEDRSAGIIIKPMHVHKALRRYLGLENSSITRQFSFTAAEDLKFFG